MQGKIKIKGRYCRKALSSYYQKRSVIRIIGRKAKKLALSRKIII
jgi:hypothetical protein